MGLDSPYENWGDSGSGLGPFAMPVDNDEFAHQPYPRAAEMLKRVRGWLVRKVTVAEIEDFLRDDGRHPEILLAIFGTTSERNKEYQLREFHDRLANHMVEGDELWWYNGEHEGEGEGVALLRDDSIFNYLHMQSEW